MHKNFAKIAAREEALHGYIKAVHDAVAGWAKQSTSGAKVWGISEDDLPQVWFYWDLAHHSQMWFRPRELITALNKLVELTGDALVREKVHAAIVALTGWREMEV